MYLRRGTAFSIFLIFIALSILSWSFVPLLSIRLQPSSNFSSFTITSKWSNVAPVIVEAQLTSKLEGKLNSLAGIKKINSVSSVGKAEITIEPDKFANLQELRLEISSAIRQLYPRLPTGISYPVITMKSQNQETEKPLLIYSLYGNRSSFTLQQYAENNIKRDLAFIPGIDKIVIYGGTGYEWEFAYKPEVIYHLSISSQEIKKALYNYFYSQPIGYTIENIHNNKKVQERYLTIKLSHAQSDSINWDSIPITKRGNRIIYLGNIARVNKVSRNINSYFRMNGHNAINIVIYSQKDANSLKVDKIIRKKIDAFKKLLPIGYQIKNTYNDTHYLQAQLTKIYQRTLFTFTILLIFVFLVSFSVRYVTLIILSLLTNLSLSFMLYYFFGVEINLYSFAGITVSLGLIIDNSLMMADHLIYRKNLKIYTAILASTLTTIASLIVVLLLPARLQLTLRDFAIIITINLFVSLIVALFFIPAYLSLFLLKRGKSILKYKRRVKLVKVNYLYTALINFILEHRAIAIAALVLAFGLPVYILPNKINSTRPFASLYNKTIGSDWYIDNMEPIVNKTLGGSLRLFSNYVFENSYYTKPEKTKIYVQASLPKGRTVKQLNNVFENIEAIAKEYKNKINFYTRIISPQFGEMVISFKKKWVNTFLPFIIKDKLISHSVNMGDINWEIFGVGEGFQNREGNNELVNYKVAIYGYNYHKLKALAKQLKERLKESPRISDIDISGTGNWWGTEKSQEYYAVLNINKLNYWGINPRSIVHFLNTRISEKGNSMSLLTGNRYTTIKIQPENLSRFDKWSILHLPIPGINHKLVEFINLKKEAEQQNIYRENQNYVRVVEYKYAGSQKFGNRLLYTGLKDLKKNFPLGYRYKQITNNFSIQKASNSYIGLILIIILIIFAICSILFESLKFPFAIILAIPASFIGIFLSFYFFDINFDQGGYASFLLISGVVVNASIYLLYEFIQLKQSHPKSSSTAIYVKAFNYKIIPILLTILSTILGLVPFIVNGQNEPFWFAFAVGTIGGLLFSIIILVFYFPLFVIKKKD